MKYRILLRSVNVNVASFNWFAGSVGSTPWETDILQEALEKYQELLNANPSNGLTLVQVVPVNIAVSV